MSGSHAYADPGNYPVTVMVSKGTILPQGAPSTSFPTLVTTVTSATIVDGGPIVGGVTINATAGQSTIASVGSFESSLTGLVFHADIDWGDGSTSNGTVTSRSDGAFDVAGTHTYASAGTYTVGVSITGTAPTQANGSTPLFDLLVSSFNSTAIVAAAA